MTYTIQRVPQCFVLLGSFSAGSMADAYMCTTGCCSRLALALAYLACYVDKAVPEGDSFCVTTFSDSVHTIVDWQRKGPAIEFDRKQFLLDCRRAIDSLERGGTGLFSAFATGYLKLKEEARVGAGAGAGAASAGHLHDSSDMSQLRTQQLVLITDGEATDPRAFERAHELACSPPIDFNFKSFLVSKPCPGCGPYGTITPSTPIPLLADTPSFLLGVSWCCRVVGFCCGCCTSILPL